MHRMKINQNISAVIVNDQLLRNEYSVSGSVKRLSSGMKFNDAKDNPSGMAISFKMQAQINALNRASANATDGTSMVETIDGAMGELTEVIQRIRELCVQGANDTNTAEDLKAIQKEIDKLKDEINRVSSDTEYNGRKLLDGSLDRRTYVSDSATGESMFEDITNVIVSDEVQANKYNVAIQDPPEYAVVGPVTGGTPAGPGGTVSAAQAGVVYINGAKAEIKEGMTEQEVYQTLRDAGDEGWVTVVPTNGTKHTPPTTDTLKTQGYEEDPAGFTSLSGQMVYVSQKYGSDEKVAIECANLQLSALLGLPSTITVTGKDAEVSIDQADLTSTDYNYTGQVVAKTTGDKVVITDKSGFEISFQVRASMDVLATPEIVIDTTDIGTLQLQVGANQDQELAIRVPVLNTESMYLDDLDVTKIDGADRGIAEADVALSIVSAARSSMGAYENRLDYIKGGLDATEEDMTNAISRLADVDMAQEMTEYTNANILTQASISVLAQANDLPQQVLSLLQG